MLQNLVAKTLMQSTACLKCYILESCRHNPPSCKADKFSTFIAVLDIRSILERKIEKTWRDT